jgi:hypothetical protein
METPWPSSPLSEELLAVLQPEDDLVKFNLSVGNG